MGVVIPQVIAEDRASGAQIIDGSLNFKQNQIPCLEFTPSSDGNRSTWTISFETLCRSIDSGYLSSILLGNI